MPNLILWDQSVLSSHSFFHFEIHSDEKGYPQNIVYYLQMALTQLTLFDPGGEGGADLPPLRANALTL